MTVMTSWDQLDDPRRARAGHGLQTRLRSPPAAPCQQRLTGISSAAAAAIGVPAIIAEAGRVVLDATAVELHERGLYRVLDRLGMTRGAGGSRRHVYHQA